MKLPLNIAILAAGKGKRMRSRLPKVLHLLAGRSLIAPVIDTARALRPTKICVVYGHGGEQVPQAIRTAGISFVRQEPQLGTGHALQQALPHLGKSGVTLVLYGDVPLIRVETLRALVTAGANRVSILTAELEDPTGYGRIVRDKDGNITGIVEEKDASAVQRKIREVNTGIMALPTARLAAWLSRLENRNVQREYYLPDVVPLALADGIAVNAVKARDAWEALGVNSKAQLAQLERIYQRQYAARLLDEGVTLIDPMRLDVRGSLKCGADVVIDVNCVFEGAVKLGDQVEIGAHCVLRNVAIGPGTRVEPFTFIDDASIGANCRIGPYARIRPGTRLAEDVHIGNFVEVKASQIAAHSKANHLAYVGDSTVGRNVNIGAGTITCNYDGARKHRTVIEDDVHIGSDVQLVAPVTVGKGATIGAGATITKDAPPGELTFTKKEQVTKPGWKRPKKQERLEE
ncbi:MAG: UDP-N-acetylglucosamine diphosphorylase/glucosamine-1-phosphate N-acetyltransferase [Betaproteobacteria bacterium RIFCSPLOWO2_12_FULL_62_58]|nr:MAG: UDP-N-acetylglucosamine diphosphorylase/glucosamine-1-phosphate N-acetyltransferase [Betaproteobacteria bacterium RIFCSPLOWO2_02_FULL_62_79]OGA55207.1 MAG: UDP-N-acetylglucosamine diphosphorylase/glucosamine-1-phosphate N-acetyltransferase [Betaproteobacteria bacterium RIFCSPLOWO2_12_FULL_62_58]